MKHLPTLRWMNWLKAFICAYFMFAGFLSLPAYSQTSHAIEANELGNSTNQIGFAGKPFDDQTGLSYIGARYYNPVIGRFMGVDPVGFQENNIHSFNRYTYANNNPYKFVDPDGRHPLLIAVADALAAAAPRAIAWFAGKELQTIAVTEAVAGLATGSAAPSVVGGVIAGGAVVNAVKGTSSLPTANRILSDATIVCRGGNCSRDAFANGKGVTTGVTGILDGVSVGLGKTVAEASANIPHTKVGVSTLGDIRAAGGKVINDHGNHGNMSGVTAEKAAELFKNVETNPNR